MVKILSVQYTPIIGNKEANLQKAYEFIEKNSSKQLDIVVLPEFFSTGIDDRAFIERPEDASGGDVVEFMQNTAKKFNTNIICGSVLIQENGKLYNTCFIINREGMVIAQYRKIHLYNYFGGNEGTYTTPGDIPVVVDLDCAKVGISMCFDIKFPMLYRKLIQKGAEIIISPSAWSTLTSLSEKEKQDFITTWQAMNICRATESLVYFVSANLTGNANKYLYSIGNSMICAPLGEVVVNAGMGDNAIYADLDLSLVRKFKTTVPVAEME